MINVVSCKWDNGSYLSGGSNVTAMSQVGGVSDIYSVNIDDVIMGGVSDIYVN